MQHTAEPPAVSRVKRSCLFVRGGGSDERERERARKRERDPPEDDGEIRGSVISRGRIKKKRGGTRG